MLILTAVFRSVVVVNVQIPMAIQLDVKATVLCQLRDHVVEEAQPRVHLPDPATIQPDLADYSSLLCFPADLSDTEQRRGNSLQSSRHGMKAKDNSIHATKK